MQSKHKIILWRCVVEEKKLVIKPKRAKGEDGYKVFSIRIKDELVVKIDDLSTKTNRSRNELIGILLQFSIDHCIVEDTKQEEISE